MLQRKPAPATRLAKTGRATPLWPRPSTDWITALVKATTNEALSTEGRRAMSLVGDLAEQRQELGDTFRDILNQIIALIQGLEQRETALETAMQEQAKRFDAIDQALAGLQSSLQAVRTYNGDTPPPKLPDDDAILKAEEERSRQFAALHHELEQIRNLVLLSANANGSGTI